jgi:hypothetical protein
MAGAAMKSTFTMIKVGLRGLMETGIVAGLASWGYSLGTSGLLKLVLAAAVPLFGSGFWGLVDFHQTGLWAEFLRLSQDHVISGAAAVAWYASGAHILGWILGSLSVVHHGLVYLLGNGLLKTW